MNKFAKLFDPKKWFYDFVKFTGSLPVLIDLRMKRIFLNKKRETLKGKYIISSNHMSYSDPVIISAAFWERRVGFVATSELFTIKFWSAFFKAVGCIPIDKTNPSLQTFKAVKENLDRGHITCVFPEGTVTRDESIKTFKSGIVMMATIADADILPVYLAKRKKRIHRQVCVIGEKINYKDYVSGSFPTMSEIETITNVLASKEKELEEYYLSTLNGNKK